MVTRTETESLTGIAAPVDHWRIARRHPRATSAPDAAVSTSSIPRLIMFRAQSVVLLEVRREVLVLLLDEFTVVVAGVLLAMH